LIEEIENRRLESQEPSDFPNPPATGDWVTAGTHSTTRRRHAAYGYGQPQVRVSLKKKEINEKPVF